MRRTLEIPLLHWSQFGEGRSKHAYGTLAWVQWLRNEFGINNFQFFNDTDQNPYVRLFFDTEQQALLYRLKY